jgi:hypothetical protein
MEIPAGNSPHCPKGQLRALPIRAHHGYAPPRESYENAFAYRGTGGAQLHCRTQGRHSEPPPLSILRPAMALFGRVRLFRQKLLLAPPAASAQDLPRWRLLGPLPVSTLCAHAASPAGSLTLCCCPSLAPLEELTPAGLAGHGLSYRNAMMTAKVPLRHSNSGFRPLRRSNSNSASSGTYVSS